MHTSTTSTAVLEPWTAEQLVQATQGHWHNAKAPQGAVKRILTDSRHAESGDAFLALQGERFDAHDFIAQVAASGCEIAIVSHPVDADICQLVVADTRLALGHLGAYRRAQHPQLKVIALTGSSGKTTVKEMLGSILSRIAPALITRGNLNNDLGVPMMLLELRREHQYAVMELGASHVGEIDYTSNLVQPDVAGILNVGTAHLGEFGGREGICRAKSEIYAHVAKTGVSIVPAADDFADAIRSAVQTEQLLSFGPGGDVYAADIRLQPQSAVFTLHTPAGARRISLPFAGGHNVQNAAAAAAFALAIGIGLDDIAAGLENAAQVGLIRCPSAQALDRSHLVAEGFKEGIGELCGVKGLLRKVCDGLFDFYGVHGRCAPPWLALLLLGALIFLSCIFLVLRGVKVSTQSDRSPF